MPPLAWGLIGWVWVYNLVWMVVQDLVKLAVYREHDRRHSGRHPFLARLNTVLHPYGVHQGDSPIFGPTLRVAARKSGQSRRGLHSGPRRGLARGFPFFLGRRYPLSYRKLFQVEPAAKLKLDEIDPGFTAKHEDKAAAAGEVEEMTKKLRELQYLLYAECKRSVLICLQALDAAGKDGVINHVLGNMNPQGTRVHGFKVPSHDEAAHDFLWRIHRQAPAQGEIVVFNRSHYEDVLVVRVHNLVAEEVWSKRYEQINEFEKGLAANGTHILKFFLHISPEEQLRRFKRRLDDPARHWKISESRLRRAGALAAVHGGL